MIEKRRRITLLCAATLLVLGLVVLLRPRPALYKVTVLPSLGGQFVLPFAINERGQVAGIARVFRRSGQSHLFLWDRAGGIRDLGLDCNGMVDINDAGQIAATLVDPNGTKRATLWDLTSGSRFLTSSGVKSEAQAINNLGQVVGSFEASPGVDHAFIWDKTNGMRDLGPGHGWTINDAGQVIVLRRQGPVIVEAGRGDVTPDRPILAKGLPRMNNRGWVAVISGSSATKPGKMDVEIWHPRSRLKVLTQVRAFSESNEGINDANQVLIADVHPAVKVLGRTIFRARETCYLHDPQRGLISLDRYICAAGPGDPFVMDLNNQGCIIAVVRSPDRRSSRGVLLEPIPKRWGK